MEANRSNPRPGNSGPGLEQDGQSWAGKMPPAAATSAATKHLAKALGSLTTTRRARTSDDRSESLRDIAPPSASHRTSTPLPLERTKRCPDGPAEISLVRFAPTQSLRPVLQSRCAPLLSPSDESQEIARTGLPHDGPIVNALSPTWDVGDRGQGRRKYAGARRIAFQQDGFCAPVQRVESNFNGTTLVQR